MNLAPLAFAVAVLTSSTLALSAAHTDPDMGGKAPAKAEANMRADADLQAVLEAHAALIPKPIEKLEPAEARAADPGRCRQRGA